MAGTIRGILDALVIELEVSMKSGLDGRNNQLDIPDAGVARAIVSMKSGLDGRNNS